MEEEEESSLLDSIMSIFRKKGGGPPGEKKPKKPKKEKKPKKPKKEKKPKKPKKEKKPQPPGPKPPGPVPPGPVPPPAPPEGGKEVLEGIRSAFVVSDNNVIELYVHVMAEEYSEEIYDIEILPEIQKPPWKKAEGIEAPEDWKFEKMGKGVRFYTEESPLLECERTKFTFKVETEKISDIIWLHVTDEDHKNMGLVYSTKW